MTTKVSIGLGGTGSNSAASTLSSIGAVAKSGDTMTGQLNISSGGLAVTGTANVSANVTVGAGSQTAPSITRSGDADTGVYFPAANEAAITTGGAVAAAFNSNGLFFRNRIINGDMRIDQRNAGASVTVNTAALNYFVDRWFAYGQATDGVFTVQRSTTAPTGFINSIIATVTTADSSLGATQLYSVAQYIEGFNAADFGWGTSSALPVTLSFWVRSSVTGTFGGAIRNAAATRSYPFTYVINSANTFEYKTITIPGDTTGTWATDNTSGPQIWLGLGAGSTLSGTAGAWAAANYVSATGATSVIGTLNATWYVTGVQLETGSVATPFERRPFTTELELCQRYYEKSYGLSVALGTGLATGFSGMTTSSAATAEAPSGIIFKVSKRADPTITIYNAVSGTSGAVYRISDAASVNVSSINYVGQSQVGYLVLASGNQNSYYYHWTASIEL